MNLLCPTFRYSNLRYILLAAMVAVTCWQSPNCRAQYDPAYVQYWKLEPMFNPASVGKQDAINLKVSMQTHATGYEDAGSTLYAGADMAFKLGNTRHGVGLSLLSDEIGLFSHKRFSLQYAYYFNLLGGKLAAGAQVDMLSENVNGGKAVTNDPSDPVFSGSEMNGSAFDASVGLYYSHKRWYAGLSMQHVSGPTIELGDRSELKVNSLYNFTTGYNISTNYPFLTLTPSAMLRYDGTDFRTDITARIQYKTEKRHLYGGINYAPQYSVALFFGLLFHGLDIGYSYEANTSGMGISAGNHEITLGYKFDLDLGKKGKNLHKSVRWL